VAYGRNVGCRVVVAWSNAVEWESHGGRIAVGSKSSRSCDHGIRRSVCGLRVVLLPVGVYKHSMVVTNGRSLSHVVIVIPRGIISPPVPMYLVTGTD